MIPSHELGRMKDGVRIFLAWRKSSVSCWQEENLQFGFWRTLRRRTRPWCLDDRREWKSHKYLRKFQSTGCLDLSSREFSPKEETSIKTMGWQAVKAGWDAQAAQIPRVPRGLYEKDRSVRSPHKGRRLADLVWILCAGGCGHRSSVSSKSLVGWSS